MNRLTLLGLSLMASIAWPALANAEDAAKDGCISVKVGDYRTPSYDCLSQQMLGADNSAAAQKNRQAQTFDVSQRASNQLGLFNQSATSIRMGNQFGVSVHPQRPTQ
jgi:hypothetical protein